MPNSSEALSENTEAILVRGDVLFGSYGQQHLQSLLHRRQSGRGGKVFPVFLRSKVRGMVGPDSVNQPVLQRFPECGPVILRLD